MTITDFIGLQDRALVESGRMAFKLVLPASYGGKWFFHCEPGKTVEYLCKFVKDSNIDIELQYPYNDVEIGQTGEDDSGKPCYQYSFFYSDYPET